MPLPSDRRRLRIARVRRIARGLAGASASPASAVAEPRRRRARRASPSPSASPAAVRLGARAVRARPARARRRRRRRPPAATLPTQGPLGELRFALEEELGPIAEQQSLSTVGAVVSSDLILQALTLILFGSIGIVLWITYRFRDFKMGVCALVSLLHDVLVVVGVVRDPRHVPRDRRSTACS